MIKLTVIYMLKVPPFLRSCIPLMVTAICAHIIGNFKYEYTFF